MIEQSDFSLGWRPSDDSLNGPKNCLLRMQNLKLDETGALTLIPGSLQALQYGILPSPPIQIYSKVIAGILYRFVSLENRVTIVEDQNGTSGFLTSSGSVSQAAYGTGYNFVIICSGAIKSKYLPTIDNLGIRDLTLPSPNAPTLTVNNPYTKDMTGTIGSYTALVGSVATSGSYVKVTPDSTILTGAASFVYGGSTDSTNLSGGSVGLDSDLFNIEVKIDDPSQVKYINVIFKDATDVVNYFEFSWENNVINIPPGVALNLQCTRGEFGINGRPSWTNIGEVVVSVDCLNTPTDLYFDNLVFSGGTLGTLDGDIEYIQVNVDNTTPYVSRSSASPLAKITCHTASTNVTPYVPTDPWSTGVEIYRRGGFLNQFTLIKSINSTSPAAFDDTVSDIEALQGGVTWDLRLSGITAISDDILCTVGPFFNRWIYFTNSSIYISLDGNPELYNIGTGILTPYGSSGEVFLSAHKFGNSAILVVTTSDFYEITGTLSELPDGTIDATIRPTGCKNPAINNASAATANELYYFASDGIRVVNPSGNAGASEPLDLLFKGKDRYGVVAPIIRGGNQDIFLAAISKNELYVVVVDTNGLRKMWVFDTLRKYWYEFKSDDGGYAAPVSLFTEEDGKLLAGYGDTGNLYVRVLNTGDLIDGTINPVVFFRTKFFNGNTPRQRKDSLTLKFKIDTGNSGVEFKLYKDESTTSTSLGFHSTGALEELAIDLSSAIGIARSYSLEITGNCPRFKLTDFSIDYIERPVPLTYFRSQPTNYNVQGRKKFYHIPFTIDTLGSQVTVTPYIDGFAQTAQTFNTGNRKQTLEYLFSANAIGTDLFYTILLTTGTSLFEYYGDVQPRVIEVLPDAVLRFNIPNTNFDTYSRKRFVAFAFVVDSSGATFNFTPTIDGQSFPTKTFSSTGKQTIVYYFDSEAVGIDIGGLITCATPFEYYGVNLQDCVSEKLPPSTTFLTIPANNLGVANKKRIRTIPLVIDTHGHDVSFIPKVDGNVYPTVDFNTIEKRTVLYYFQTDAFGIDVSGTLSGASNFEFYGMLNPENVEVIPVGKLFDQLGPVEFNRQSNVKGFRVRLITTGNIINYTVYIDDVAKLNSSFSVIPNVDKVYEVPWLTKFLNGTTCRIELQATAVFHRFSAELKNNPSGAGTQAKWSKL